HLGWRHRHRRLLEAGRRHVRDPAPVRVRLRLGGAVRAGEPRLRADGHRLLRPAGLRGRPRPPAGQGDRDRARRPGEGAGGRAAFRTRGVRALMSQTSYLRFPHLAGDLLTFVAEDDVWLAELGAGAAGPVRATRFTSDWQPACNPQVSPDGAHVAWVR